MKNSFKILSLLLALSLTMAGCSKTAAESSKPVTTSSTSDTAKSGENGPQGERGMPETEALAENQTQATGKVTSITGNQLVLALGEMKMPEMPADGKAPNGDDKVSESKEGETAPSGDAPKDGEKPSGEKPSGDAPTGDAPKMDGQDGDKGGNFEVTLTGESVTYTIADDIAVSQMGKNDTASDAASIAADMTVKVVIEKATDGTETVVKVQILQS